MGSECYKTEWSLLSPIDSDSLEQFFGVCHEKIFANFVVFGVAWHRGRRWLVCAAVLGRIHDFVWPGTCSAGQACQRSGWRAS